MNPVATASVTDAPVRGIEHWTNKGDVRLFLWEKFVGSPEGKPVVLFVHGSSVMDWFARRGFACWCVDMEGYGRSDKSRDIYCDVSNSVDDLAAATDYMRKARGIESVMAYGISS